MVHPPTPETICAVVVTYHPDAAFEERLSHLEGQVSRTFVVDNGSSEEERARLVVLANSNRIELLSLTENAGVGAALNVGIERAIASGFSWAITFDQDSVAHDDLIERLISIYRQHPEPHRLATIGANYEEDQTGATGTPKWRRRRGDYIEVDQVITSGCLQSLDVFREIGPYREDLFIYSIDNDYCARARLAGFAVILSKKPLIRHKTGNQLTHRLAFLEIATANYAPWRHYYIVRNGVVLLKEYLATDTVPSLRRSYSIVRRSIAALALEEDRGAKLRYMARGIRDGLAGRTGKLTGTPP